MASLVDVLQPDQPLLFADMLVVLTQLRERGHLVTLDTTPEAIERMAATLDMPVVDVTDAFRQAPAERDRFRWALAQPVHHGCEHLRRQLERGPHAATLLDAFITASWYGWPGLRFEIGEADPGACCCGLELTPRAYSRHVSVHRPMSAIDI
jgi:hypothetical protein